MNYDTLYTCSRCSSDCCYKQELKQDFYLEHCMGCGFQTSTAYNNEEMLEMNIKFLPTIYKILIDQEEDTLKIWIPSFTEVPNKGVVYANGIDRDNWWWEAARFDPHSSGKFKREDIKIYPSEKGFMDALEYIGVFE